MHHTLVIDSMVGWKINNADGVSVYSSLKKYVGAKAMPVRVFMHYLHLNLFVCGQL